MGIKQRRRREKQQRRHQILDAARSLLFRNGLKAISINQIAREAELSVGTIYFYFRGKEDIFAVLQEEGLTLLEEDVLRAHEKGSEAKDSLHNIAQAYLHFSQQHKNYFDVINYFLSAGEILFEPEIKAQVDQHGNRILKIVERALCAGIEEGQFRRMHVRRHALLFWVMLHGLVPFRKMQDTLLAGDSLTMFSRFAVDNYIRSLSPMEASQKAFASGRQHLPGE